MYLNVWKVLITNVTRELYVLLQSSRSAGLAFANVGDTPQMQSLKLPIHLSKYHADVECQKYYLFVCSAQRARSEAKKSVCVCHVMPRLSPRTARGKREAAQVLLRHLTTP